MDAKTVHRWFDSLPDSERRALVAALMKESPSEGTHPTADGGAQSQEDDGQSSATASTDVALPKKQPSIVLFFVSNTSAFWPDYFHWAWQSLLQKCRADCTFHPPDVPAEVTMSADALIFHGPYMHSLHPDAYFERHGPKPAHQQWWMVTWESDANHPVQVSHHHRQHIDHKMSFEMDSTVPISYASTNWKHDFFYLDEDKRTDAYVVFIVANCDGNWIHNERVQWLSVLMQEIPTHSYGTCLHNKDWEFDVGGRESKRKLKLYSKYKFCIAFENSNQVDYVSEKFYNTLSAGCVPVVMGAPNIDDYLPHPDAVVKAADFPNAKGLAKHLQWLIDNPEEYNKKLAWKKTRQGEEKLNRLRYLSMATGPCRVCEHVAGVSSERTPEEELELWRANMDVMVTHEGYKRLIDSIDDP